MAETSKKQDPYHLTLERTTRLISAVEDLINIADTEDCTMAKMQLTQWKHDLESIYRGVKKVRTLIEFKGYRFAIVDPSTGEVRQATPEEGQRLIMGYPPKEAGGAEQIMERMKNYVKHYGQQPDTSNWEWLKDKHAVTDAERKRSGELHSLADTLH